MDPQELERRKQEARDAGYTDAEIAAALGQSQTPTPSTAPAVNAEMPAAPVAPTSPAFTPPPDQVGDRSAEKWTTGVAGAGLGAAAVGGPLLLYKGAKAVADAFRNAPAPAGAQPGSPAANLNQLVGRPGQVAMPPTAAPAAGAAGSPIQLPQNVGSGPRTPGFQTQMSELRTPPSMPAPNPMAQQAIAQQAQTAQAMANPTANNFIERMSTLARQYGPAAARVGAGAGFGLYSGGLNTNEAEELRRRRTMSPTITP